MIIIIYRNLLNKDVLSKSDPMCVMYVELQNRTWQEHGRTEIIQNSLNPEFATKLKIGYRFEEHQKLKFKIYDIDSRNPVLDAHDFLGEADCSLGQIVSSNEFTAPLISNGRSQGQICLRAEEVGSLKEDVEFVFTGQKFKKSGFFSKPDPFLAIYKDGNNLVYRSNFIKDNLNPRWPKFTLPMRALKTKDGQDAQLSLQVWNYNQNGSHKSMGEVQVTTRDLMEPSRSFSLKKKTSNVFNIFF